MKPPRLQLHLSTCIVLMFVAGGLMWANVAPHHYNPPLVGPDGSWILDGTRGWPELYDWGGVTSVPRYDWAYLAVDVLLALAILAATAFICEWVIRRKALKVES